MKNRIVTALLAIFLGAFGGQKFYLGKTGQGVLCLIFWWTLIPGLFGFVEGLTLLGMSDEDFDAKYNLSGHGRLLQREKYELERKKLKIEHLKLERELISEESKLKKSVGDITMSGEQADELAAWHDLLEKGIIDENTYEQKKKIILGLD
jgi:TM2 domain-containing membrane protein YozV